MAPSPNNEAPTAQRGDPDDGAARLPEIIRQALAFASSRWVGGSVVRDPFYQSAGLQSDAQPGDLLRLEETSDASLWALPPSLAFSRFVYQTKTLQDKSVPASAFVLWPYSARKNQDGSYQVLIWTHGTTGIDVNAAPSHYVDLYQHYLGPYILALAGYTVIGLDYAGLGVGKTTTGESIVLEYCAFPAQANDAAFAFQAARRAFPSLGERFLVVGHSLGGGAAWGFALRQISEPIPGYLGAVALAPITNALKKLEPTRSIVVAGMFRGMRNFFPDEDFARILTPEGKKKIETAEALGGNTATFVALVTGSPLFRDGWTEDPHVNKYLDLVSSGGRPFVGPLLVVQGTEDKAIPCDTTVAAVEASKRACPEGDISLHLLPGLGHMATMCGSQYVWLDWIADRFAGRPTSESNVPYKAEPARPLESISNELNWYPQKAKQVYETG